MPGIVRFNDISAGHTCWPPRRNDQASLNVFTNNKGTHRQTDHWPTHTCPPPHDGRLQIGSPNVFVNSLPVARSGDPVDCGDHALECSIDTFAN